MPSVKGICSNYLIKFYLFIDSGAHIPLWNDYVLVTICVCKYNYQMMTSLCRNMWLNWYEVIANLCSEWRFFKACGHRRSNIAKILVVSFLDGKSVTYKQNTTKGGDKTKKNKFLTIFKPWFCVSIERLLRKQFFRVVLASCGGVILFQRHKKGSGVICRAMSEITGS